MIRPLAPIAAAAGSHPWRGGRRRIEWLRWACYGASALSALAFAGLLALLVVESLPVWRAGWPLGRPVFRREGMAAARWSPAPPATPCSRR